jgi:hypothetical protein
MRLLPSIDNARCVDNNVLSVQIVGIKRHAGEKADVNVCGCVFCAYSIAIRLEFSTCG